MQPLSNPRLALIGCGAIVDHHSLRALLRAGWAPSVLVDMSNARLDAIAQKMGSKGARVIKANDWRSVADQFDAAIVSLPHALHAPFGVELAEAGKHVFMEKPLAITGEECRAMTSAAERSGTVLSVGLLRRYLHVARWTKALIEAGVLGEVRTFEAREGFVYNYEISSSFFLESSMAGGGVLMDTGAHTLDLILWWLGGVASLAYRDDARGGVEADCRLDLVCESGATGSVELSRTRNLQNTVRIVGSRGFVEVHLYQNRVIDGSPEALAFMHEGIGAKSMIQQQFPELFEAEFKDFRAAIGGLASAGVSGQAGTQSVDLIERCYAARTPLVLPWAEEGTRSVSRRLPAGAKVAVIGATGFIGGRFVERLVEQEGVQVRAIVRNLGHSMRLARLPVEIVKTDLTDAAAVESALEGTDYVFNCAYDLQSHKHNLEGLRNVIAASAKARVQRLVHLSSFSVYQPFPDGELTEETRDGDRSVGFVANKLDIEANVFAWAAEFGIEATVLQPSIVYGPFSKPWTNAPAEMLIFGDVVLPDGGQGLCNAVYVDDVTDAMLLAAVKPGAPGERFLITGPETVTWSTFFRSFAEKLGTNPPTFWPEEQIVRQSSGPVRGIVNAVSNPREIIKTIIRSKRGRNLVQACLDVIPARMRSWMLSAYQRGGSYKVGELILPDPQTLALYASQAVANTAKARQVLGYEPRFDFTRGMELTGAYVNWAYRDVKHKVAPQRGGGAGKGRRRPAEGDATDAGRFDKSLRQRADALRSAG